MKTLFAASFIKTTLLERICYQDSAERYISSCDIVFPEKKNNGVPFSEIRGILPKECLSVLSFLFLLRTPAKRTAAAKTTTTKEPKTMPKIGPTVSLFLFPLNELHDWPSEPQDACELEESPFLWWDLPTGRGGGDAGGGDEGLSSNEFPSYLFYASLMLILLPINVTVWA